MSPAAGESAGANSAGDAASRIATREFDFLCACAGVQLSADRIATIAAWRDHPIDWNELLRQAEHHGLLPLLARSLTLHASGIPTKVELALRSAFDTNLRRSLWFASELARIVEQLEKQRVRAIPYKGPLLAESAYGDVALRNFGDLDFLISPTDFDRAKESLSQLGYSPSSELSPAVERFWLRNGYERSFDSAAGKYLVELQWALLPRFYAVHLPTEDLIARARPVSFGGSQVHALSPEDTLFVLCLHAAKHLWMRLIWVCDIAETLRTQTIDWAVLLERARQSGVLRILGVSFWLTHHLLGCPLTEAAQSLISRDSGVNILGEMFATRLAHGTTYDFESTEYFRLNLQLRERRSDQVRSLWRLLFTPGDGDLKAIHLPEPMFPMYRAVRAVRLLRRIHL